MEINRVKINHLFDPIGISVKDIRFTWNVYDCKKQSGFQIKLFNENDELLFDSQLVNSSSMNYLVDKKYHTERSIIKYSIVGYDENENPSNEYHGQFETGFKDGYWPAKWISGNYKVNKKKRYPVDCFKKEFNLSKSKKGRLYATSCGLYKVLVNGKEVTDSVLNPGITDYRKMIHYQTFDVTDLLVEGKNTMEVMLADGWYRGSVGAWGLTNQYGTVTKFSAALISTTVDEKEETIITDNSFSYSNDGPIRFADNKDGEIIDSNMVASYSDKAIETKCDVIPVCSNNVLIKEHEHFKAELIITKSNKKVLNFKQNIAGYVSFKLNCHKGDKVTLYFGEMLDENGEFTQKNIQCSNKKKTTPLQKVEYIAHEGLNQYKTTFAIFGFQYVLVDTDLDIDPNCFESIAVYSDMERTGYFNCSNPLINQFFENTVFSLKGNSCDLPTDCPTRERHGWTGDAQIFCNTASYLFDYSTFGQKFVNDMYCWQRKDGCLPHIAPDGGADFYMYIMNGSSGWADAGVIIPYVLYKKYNDVSFIKENLDSMIKYVDFLQKRCRKVYPLSKPTKLKRKFSKYINNYGPSYGEWAEPDDVHQSSWTDFVFPHPEEQTAYTIYVNELLAEMLKAIGEEELAKKYSDFAYNSKIAYQHLRKENKEYSLDTDRQASLVRPLYFNLLDEEDSNYARERLIKAIKDYGYRLNTGFLSTPLIMYVLDKYDVKTAYKLLLNEDIPGWLAMAKDNSTTIWEAWEGNKNKNVGLCSLNHYSKGAVCSWLFEGMCGIKVVGENKFQVKPIVDDSLTYAEATYDSIYGRIKVRWQYDGNKYKYFVSIPSNCSCEVILDDQNSYIQEEREAVYESNGR